MVLGLHAPLWAAAPRLVIVVVADQMRADYVARYGSEFSPDGLGRLLKEGAVFENAAYDYAATKTAPGHALIGSGLYPSQNGIIGNEWYDRSLRKSVKAADLAPSPDGRVTLRWWTGRSLSQNVRSVYPHARIFGISYKDRGALLLGGPGQDNAFWWDKKAKRFRAFSGDPSWLKAPAADMREPGRYGQGADDITATTALALWDAEKLGQNPQAQPDVLCVSFSELDLVGHRYGPDAEQTKAALLRMDAALARLVRYGLTRFKPEEMFWVFTSDHGVTPVPQVSRRQGFEAERIEFPRVWRKGRGAVEAVSPPFVYLTRDPEKLRGKDLAGATEDARREILSWKGVEAVYTGQQIDSGQAPAAIQKSYFPGRSGDLFVVLKPRSIFSRHIGGTTHGQPTPDDQAVPLLFWGSGVSPSRHPERITPARIAPTLMAVLGIPTPGLEASLTLYSR